MYLLVHRPSFLVYLLSIKLRGDYFGTRLAALTSNGHMSHFQTLSASSESSGRIVPALQRMQLVALKKDSFSVGSQQRGHLQEKNQPR